MTPFQKKLFENMIPGVWYNVFEEQGAGGATLPDWFYQRQAHPMATIRTMVESGKLKMRKNKASGPLPQVCRAKRKKKKRKNK